MFIYIFLIIKFDNNYYYKNPVLRNLLIPGGFPGVTIDGQLSMRRWPKAL